MTAYGLLAPEKRLAVRGSFMKNIDTKFDDELRNRSVWQDSKLWQKSKLWQESKL